jgi:sugar phosphate isomerase/epimerase
MDRRRFLSATTAGVASLALLRPRQSGRANPARAGREPAPELDADTVASTAIKLGVASYSLRQLDRKAAISAIKALGTPYVCIKSMHLPYESSPNELAAGRREFEDAGLEIVGGGVIYLQKEDDDDIRFHFDYARAAGMPLMVIGPTPATLPRIERFVAEYDIKVAIHNHGPEDQHFPGPRDALEVIRDMDPRVGVCIDLGHTARTGVDVVEAIAEAGPRLLDVHIKDLRDLRDGGSQCVVGEGAMPVVAIFRQLEAMGYAGYVNLEYEIEPENPLPGMKQSFAFMRGVLAGLREAED